MIDDGYTFEDVNGRTHTGPAAYVLNHLDSALASMEDNMRDVRADATFSDDDVREECELHSHVAWLLANAQGLAAYI